MRDAKWTNAIVVPKDGLLVPAIITGLILLTIIILGLLAAYWISRVTIHRSTKPLHAALFMTQTMSLFRAYSKDEDMPDRIVSRMNYDLNKNNESCMFVTLFVGILDLTSGLMHYSNAGHEPPVVIRSKGEKESWSKGEKVAQLLPIEPCFLVGLTTDVSYVTQTVVLEPQATVFFYTDGLNEAANGNEKLFGDERILDEVNRAIETGQLSPKALIDRMTQAVHEFVGDAEQSDDLTMLVVQYHKHD